MRDVTLIRPTDQPPGKRRLLEDLKKALRSSRYNNFRIIVAFAKSGPLVRLRDHLSKWREANKSSAAIIGLDHRGTSRQALVLARSLFDSVYVTQEKGITFHPKIYFFGGERQAEAFIGSNNLTVGGTETNFEAAVHLKLEIPTDARILGELESAWSDLLPDQCKATDLLDRELLRKLIADGVVIDEKNMRWSTTGRRSGDSDIRRSSGINVQPPSPLPRPIANGVQDVGLDSGQPETSSSVAEAQGHAIQIKPHHNGEIFLSVTAVLQNPDFFSWPFNGVTTPKIPGNPTYPQRVPDPIVNIEVFGRNPEPMLRLTNYPLNTVYYERRSEIRITASPLVGVTPEYSIMVMKRSEVARLDYEIAIHRPDSPNYGTWLRVCNQRMPGGGRRPRMFGWF